MSLRDPQAVVAVGLAHLLIEARSFVHILSARGAAFDDEPAPGAKISGLSIRTRAAAPCVDGHRQ